LFFQIKKARMKFILAFIFPKEERRLKIKTLTTLWGKYFAGKQPGDYLVKYKSQGEEAGAANITIPLQETSNEFTAFTIPSSNLQ
jgi:hypothetical protein